MPLEGENQYDTDKVVNTILPSKDVDGLTNVNAGKLSRGNTDKSTFVPCTPKGCLELIEETGIDVSCYFLYCCRSVVNYILCLHTNDLTIMLIN